MSTAMNLNAAMDSDSRGVWTAPGRVNLIGEHTDYNRGLVLPFAINRRATCDARLRNDHKVRVSSTFASEPVEISLDEVAHGEFSGWSAYALGVAWALLESATDPAGVDIVIDSAVPVGAGLSSSAAIECAVAVALNDLWGSGLAPMALALACQRAENVAVGAPTGIMDQVASLHGREDHVVALDCDSLAISVLPLGLARSGVDVMVMDSGIKHAHATGGYTDRREACERGAKTLGVASLREITPADLSRAKSLLDDSTFRRVRHVVTENERVAAATAALAGAGPDALAVVGDLMNSSHDSMRDDFEISVPEIDVAVEAARGAGALGARLTGGGFGGAAVALVPHDRWDDVAAAVTDATDRRSFTRPTIFEVRPDDGARRES